MVRYKASNLKQVMQKMKATNFPIFCLKNSGVSGLDKNETSGNRNIIWSSGLRTFTNVYGWWGCQVVRVTFRDTICMLRRKPAAGGKILSPSTWRDFLAHFQKKKTPCPPSLPSAIFLPFLSNPPRPESFLLSNNLQVGASATVH